MKYFIIIVAIATMTTSCKNNKGIVDNKYIDSLLTNYKPSPTLKQNEEEVNFWKARIDTKNYDLVNLSKYANALTARFKLVGNINDLLLADSILKDIDKHFIGKDANIKLTLMNTALLQHQFVNADSFLQQAKGIGIGEYETNASTFDVNFELGNYTLSAYEINKIKNYKDYNYLFRNSKMFHYNGNVDSAIANMQAANVVAGENIPLKQSAISNTADLYLHDGQLKKANELYMQSMMLNNIDLHSLLGIGTIALLNDKNDSLAEKIFLFVKSKTNQPDVLFKLAQVAVQRGDSINAKKFAIEFVSIVTKTSYGNMYNKYVIQVYTSILNEPVKAEIIAKRELETRATAQTYAWYVWSLVKNNKLAEATKIFEQYVSGKPLEGLELYWMGKYMQANNKGYNAEQFFEKAKKNKYDLSVDMIMDLDKK